MSFEANQYGKLTPEQIQDEELWLLNRQVEHGAVMDDLGITEKAKDIVGRDRLNNLSRPAIALSRKQEGGTVSEIISIRFATPGLSASGHSTVSYLYAPVLEITHNDAITIEGEYTLDEVEAVINMATGLKQAKDLGVLPHLSYDLANIHNPLTAMKSAPTQTN
jgi:hypothetical protein